MENRLNQDHYFALVQMAAEIVKNAPMLGLTLPLELHISGADDDDVLHCTVSQDFKFENLSDGELRASFPITLTMIDKSGNRRDYTIRAEDLRAN